MQVGAENQTIEVGAEAAPVETINPTLGQSITGRTLTNMPLNGRDMLDLALLQPGVTESNDDNFGAGKYSIAGARTDSVTFLLDGGLNNDLLDNSNLLDPNPDAVAEFKLLASDYTAEYGRNGGGIISVVTRSGTNQIHGSLFEFLRNRALDANDYFNIPAGLPRLDLKRNQYGATLGGPIIKDKAFFFLAYQGQREVRAVPDVLQPVFAPEWLNGDFSHVVPFDNVVCLDPAGCPDPGVAKFLKKNPYFAKPIGNATEAIIDPSKFDPVAMAYIKAGLIPSAPGGVISEALSRSDNRDELTSKFDLNLSAKDKLSATVGLNRTFSTDPFPFANVGGFPSKTVANYYFVNIGYTRIISPTLLNEFHFVAHRSNYRGDIPGNSLPTGPSLGIQITPDLATGPTNIFFDNGFLLGPSENGPTRYVENTFSWTDAVSWTRGKHNWKFGAGFSPYQENLVYDYYTNGEFDFYSDGICHGESLCQLPSGSGGRLLPGRPGSFEHPQQEHLHFCPGRMARTQESCPDRRAALRIQHAEVGYSGPHFLSDSRTAVAAFCERAARYAFSRRSRRPERHELPGQERLCAAFRLCLGSERERQDQHPRRLRSFLRHSQGRRQSSV